MAQYSFRFLDIDNKETATTDILYSCEAPESLPQVLVRFVHFLQAVGFNTKGLEFEGEPWDELDW